jgi:hypothetical protein
MEYDQYEVVERGNGNIYKTYTHCITKFTACLLKACALDHIYYAFAVNCLPRVIQTGKHSNLHKSAEDGEQGDRKVNFICGAVQIHTGFRNRKHIQLWSVVRCRKCTGSFICERVLWSSVGCSSSPADTYAKFASRLSWK